MQGSRIAVLAVLVGCVASVVLHGENTGGSFFTGDPCAAGGVTSIGAIPSSVAHVSSGNTDLYFGYAQVSGTNQDAVFMRFDGGVRTCCQRLETSGDDSGAGPLAWDTVSGLVAVGSTTKGNQAGGFSTYSAGTLVPNFFGSNLASSYGSSRNVPITVVATVDVTDCTTSAATFLGARLDAGGANSCVPRWLDLDDTGITVYMQSFFSPYANYGSAQGNSPRFDCSGSSSPLPYIVRVSHDLTQALSICSYDWCQSTGNASSSCAGAPFAGDSCTGAVVCSGAPSPSSSPSPSSNSGSGSMSGSVALRGAGAFAIMMTFLCALIQIQF